MWSWPSSQSCLVREARHLGAGEPGVRQKQWAALSAPMSVPGGGGGRRTPELPSRPPGCITTSAGAGVDVVLSVLHAACGELHLIDHDAVSLSNPFRTRPRPGADTGMGVGGVAGGVGGDVGLVATGLPVWVTEEVVRLRDWAMRAILLTEREPGRQRSAWNPG